MVLFFEMPILILRIPPMVQILATSWGFLSGSKTIVAMVARLAFSKPNSSALAFYGIHWLEKIWTGVSYFLAFLNFFYYIFEIKFVWQ